MLKRHYPLKPCRHKDKVHPEMGALFLSKAICVSPELYRHLPNRHVSETGFDAVGLIDFTPSLV